jgi:Ni/Co efflux regulator RcnB
MKKFLTALISVSFLALPLALVTVPAHAKTAVQAQDGQTGAKTKAKSKSKAKSKKSSAKKAKKPTSAPAKATP